MITKRLLTLTAAALIVSLSSSAQIHGAKEIQLQKWDFTKDGASWQSVTTPHSYNAADGHSARYYRGEAEYRTKVNVEASDACRPAFLLFEEAAQRADVYLNGELLTTHKGGYTPFSINVTGRLTPGENEVRVVCDNSEDLNMIPVSSDFNKNGGLHGDVHLVFMNSVYADLSTRYGPYRMHVSPLSVSKELAEAEVNADIANATDSKKNVRVKVSIVNAAGKVVLFSEKGLELQPASTTPFSAVLKLYKPHLWNGLKDPYLYTVKIEIRDAKSKKVFYDEVGTEAGFRYYSADPDKGFFLNGESYPLRGVAMHQDTDGKASAMTKEDFDRDYAIVKDLGANFMRLAHYPHNDYAFRLCDRMGIIVQTEIPWVNVCGKNVKPEYFANIETQMREMIGSHYNHPSICFWGMWNEVDSWGNVEGKLQGAFNPEAVVAETGRLYGLAKSLDPHRLVGLTDDSVFRREGYTSLEGDYYSENRYNGWYYDVDDFEAFTKDMNEVRTKMQAPVNVAEYGVGVNPYCHTWNPADVSHSDDTRHFEEYGNLYHESYVRQIAAMPWLNFTSLWILFDFPVASREEGYIDSSDGVHFTANEARKYMNDKGLVTRDRKTFKDTYYLYRSLWNHSEETVYITSRRLTEIPVGKEFYIKVYSSAPSLTLFRDGSEVGRKDSSGENTGVIWTFGPFTKNSGAETFKVVSPSGLSDEVTKNALTDF